MKRVAILQSNYIPWMGYFDIIRRVDEFVIYDDAQYTKNDWRNRNKIKTPQGLIWLTIPVKHEHLHQKISEVETVNNSWREKHWKTISQNYSKAKYFKDFKDVFETLYLKSEERSLSLINFQFIKAINEILNIKTLINWSTNFEKKNDRTENLVYICKKLNATHYFSGPSAKDYLEEKKFLSENIKLEYIDYSGYVDYPQLFGKFERQLSILDLIYNTGKDATNYF